MFPSFALVFLIALLYVFMSYPETIGTSPLPEKLIFISDLWELRLCITSTLTKCKTTPYRHPSSLLEFITDMFTSPYASTELSPLKNPFCLDFFESYKSEAPPPSPLPDYGFDTPSHDWIYQNCSVCDQSLNSSHLMQPLPTGCNSLDEGLPDVQTTYSLKVWEYE